MYHELSKSEKKIARQLIDKGLDIAYTHALAGAEAIIEKWRSQMHSNRESYLNLFKNLNKHDDDIAHRYNGLGGSRWLGTVADLFAEEIITKEEIQAFSEETKNIIYTWSEWKKK